MVMSLRREKRASPVLVGEHEGEEDRSRHVALTDVKVRCAPVFGGRNVVILSHSFEWLGRFLEEDCHRFWQPLGAVRDKLGDVRVQSVAITCKPTSWNIHIRASGFRASTAGTG
jgi:hypothetical protein